MIAGKELITRYIPQREPMVMIDTLLDCAGKSCSTSFEITSNNMFCENDVFTESGLLENMAQTAAAKVGFECLQANVPVPPGFIGAIKNLVVHAFPKTGEVLHTTIDVTHEVFGVTVITGKVEVNGMLMAETEMKIVIQNQA